MLIIQVFRTKLTYASVNISLKGNFLSVGSFDLIMRSHRTGMGAALKESLIFKALQSLNRGVK